MVLRSSARTALSHSSTPTLGRGSPAIGQSTSTSSPQLLELRKQWKWAAVSQFFYTFAPLIAVDEVELVDVENDLVNSTMIVLPRLMQRLLITLTQDRKINVDNWQSSLRRQYLRRDPLANPIGSEPMIPRLSRATTVELDGVKSEHHDSALENAAQDVNEDYDLTKDSTDHNGSLNDRKENEGSEGVQEVPEMSIVNGVAHAVGNESVAKVEPDDTRNWTELTMLEKLNSIHTVIEWHFQAPMRLRTIMRSDDDNASWRIEPIGYDAKRNAYWLIGPDRLWIQRQQPKLPKKRKEYPKKYNGRTTNPSTVKKDSQNTAKPPALKPKHRRTGSSKSTRVSPREKNAHEPPSPPIPSSRVRAAKTRANAKLDLQAKQLAAAKAELKLFGRNPPGQTSHTGNGSSPRRSLRTRASRRLRGNDDDDEWQQIPVEWLTEAAQETDQIADPSPNGVKDSERPRKRLRSTEYAVELPKVLREEDSGEESELTELSESDTAEPETIAKPGKHAKQGKAVDEIQQEKESTEAHTPELIFQNDFVEWETLCVSLQEWENITLRFETATHYLEKALYKTLTDDIVPIVCESLREAERQRLKEEALMNRKRSSRIAIKETEKETARLAVLKQAEEEEKMARARRSEARARREEEERLKRELAREQRRKEREEREVSRAKRKEVVLNSDSPKVDAIIEPDAMEIMRNTPATNAVRRPKPRKHAKRSSTDDWELDCEVCGTRGVNKDEHVPLMSCGKCNKWQHINCHNAADRNAGQPLRNWDDEEFTCKRCLSKQTNSAKSIPQPSYMIPRWQIEPRTSHLPALTSVSTSSLDQSASKMDYYSSESVTGHTNFQNHAIDNHSTGTWRVNGSHNGPSEMIHALNKKNTPHQSQPVTFAHYQPLERGFSPHPSTLHPSLQYQSSGSSTHLPYSMQPVMLHHKTQNTLDDQMRGNNINHNESYGTTSTHRFASQTPHSMEPVVIQAAQSRPTPSSSAPVPSATPQSLRFAQTYQYHAASGTQPYYRT